MNECESCIHYPPSSLDEPPCCYCQPTDPLLMYYRNEESADDAAIRAWLESGAEGYE